MPRSPRRCRRRRRGGEPPAPGARRCSRSLARRYAAEKREHVAWTSSAAPTPREHGWRRRVCGHAMIAISAAMRSAEPDTASDCRKASRRVVAQRVAAGRHPCQRMNFERAAYAGALAAEAGGRRQEAATLRDEHGLRAITNVECFEHGAHVSLDRAFRDIECARDFFVPEAAAEHADDFELTQRRGRWFRRRRGRRPARTRRRSAPSESPRSSHRR